jgi:signal transduction histidine kinase
MLDDLGLPAAAEWLATNLRARSDLEISLEVASADGQPFGRLEPGVELALYRVAQEALNNTLKHAQASRAEVWLTRDADSVRLRVADNGRGLPVNGDGPSPTSLGLLGMRERLAEWNATVSVDNAVGGGVEVSARVPLAGEASGPVDLAAAA